MRRLKDEIGSIGRGFSKCVVTKINTSSSSKDPSNKDSTKHAFEYGGGTLSASALPVATVYTSLLSFVVRFLSAVVDKILRGNCTQRYFEFVTSDIQTRDTVATVRNTSHINLSFSYGANELLSISVSLALISHQTCSPLHLIDNQRNIALATN